jgi:hypothetical protein
MMISYALYCGDLVGMLIELYYAKDAGEGYFQTMETMHKRKQCDFC